MSTSAEDADRLEEDGACGGDSVDGSSSGLLTVSAEPDEACCKRAGSNASGSGT